MVNAFFRRIGVARVNSVPALLETLKLLHIQGSLPGKHNQQPKLLWRRSRLDRGRRRSAAGLNFVKPLSPDAAAAIAVDACPSLSTISNPAGLPHVRLAQPHRVDRYLRRHDAGRRRSKSAYPRFSPPRKLRHQPIGILQPQPWQDAAQATGSRAAVLATLPDAMPEAHAESRWPHKGIVPFFGLDEALAAISRGRRCRRAQATDAPILVPSC